MTCRLTMINKSQFSRSGYVSLGISLTSLQGGRFLSTSEERGTQDFPIQATAIKSTGGDPVGSPCKWQVVSIGVSRLH